MVHNSSNHDIDILLGLLVYLVWSNQQVYNKPNIHVFSQLAIAAVYELGIHDPSANGKYLQLCVATEPDEGYSASPSQTMEERRAVLGCFLITSIIATFLQRTDSLRWTPYMDECLQMLEEHQECPNDEILVQQVRLQLMNEKLAAGGRHGGLTTTLDLLHTPPAFYLRPIETQLQSIKSRIAPHSQGYNTLLLHHYHTISILNESARTKATSTNNSNLQKIECLYACLDATKSWFEVFLSIPPAEYIGFPFSIFSQMVYNLLTLYNLSTLEDPDWDTNNVRQIADVLSIFSKVIHNMGQVATLVGLNDNPDSDIFSRVAKMYRSVQMGWEAKLGYDSFLTPAMVPAQQRLPEPLDAMPINFPQVGDDDWLLDMLNSITQSNRV